jgi:hypothetical protein
VKAHKQLVLVLFLISPARMLPASVIPTEWLHNTGVQQFEPNDSEFTPITMVTVPLNTTSNAALGASTASTTYDIQAIADSYISYEIATQHSCVNANSVTPRCMSTGQIFFTPRTDVSIDFQLEYSYSLGADWMTASQSVVVYEWPAHEPSDLLFFMDQDVTTTFKGPHSGVLSFPGGGVTLQGGSLYRVAYAQSVSIINAPVDASAVATGSILITITSIPEPASALGLLACLLLFHRRRHR